MTVSSKFSVDDPPDAVCALLEQVAAELPMVAVGARPTAVATGPASYDTTLPVGSPAQADAATAQFLRWLWYAARRAGLHLDGSSHDGYVTPDRAQAALALLAPTLHIRPEEVPEIAGSVRLERYGDGEVIARFGRVPDRLGFIVEGRASLVVPLPDGGSLPFAQLATGDAVGLTALTRERT